MFDVMLNTNVYCRPLDEPTDETIESESKLAKEIFALSRSGAISIVTSEILYYEINKIEDKTKQEIVFHLAQNVEENLVVIDEKVEELADKILEYMKDYADCLHMASACIGGCDYMVTCDKELLRKAQIIERFLLELNFKLHIVSLSEFMKILGKYYGK